MYEVIQINNNVNTVVHYPSNDQNDPHLNRIQLTEELSMIGSLVYSLYPNNPGYANVNEIKTRIKVIDVRDQSIRFVGRVINISEKMDSSGVMYKEITCEDALSYLNDTKQRGSTYTDSTAKGFITQILNDHNSKMDDTRKIYIGDVNITHTSNFIHTNEYKSTLAEILTAVNEYGGYIKVRETNGVLYLDWLKSFANNTLTIELGTNMKDLVREKDLTNFGTRIIPLGANNITIESVNGGKDYIEDTNSVNAYGVIEKTVNYNGIETPAELKTKCMSEISNYTQPSYTLEVGALDLSYLSNNKAEQFYLGVNIRILNSYMGIDSVYSITKVETDLLKPYDSNLTISNKDTLTVTINNIRNETIQNDGVYNNVQIGKTYGIRVMRNDNKVVTTLNATEGISIKNNNKTVFSVDDNGDIIVNDGTFNNITANDGTFNNITANGGTFNDIEVDIGVFNDIEVNTGTFTDIEVNSGVFNDIEVNTGTFNDIVMDGGLEINDDDTACFITSEGIRLEGPNGEEANIQILDDGEYSGSYIRDDMYVEDVLRVFGNLKVETDARIYGDLEVEGEMYVNGGDTLEEYIRDIIHDYSVDKGWED